MLKSEIRLSQKRRLFYYINQKKMEHQQKITPQLRNEIIDRIIRRIESGSYNGICSALSATLEDYNIRPYATKTIQFTLLDIPILNSFDSYWWAIGSPYRISFLKSIKTC